MLPYGSKHSLPGILDNFHQSFEKKIRDSISDKEAIASTSFLVYLLINHLTIRCHITISAVK
jgi:hypothetical protein